MSWRRALALLGLVTVVAASSSTLPAQSQSVPAAQVDPSLLTTLEWRPIGPMRAGRTRAAAGHASHPYTFYAGATNGGVWKTTDAGRTWFPIFDDQPTQSIGALALAQSNPDILYVGSGEGLHRPDLSVGDGMYKSTDAGKTWTHLGMKDVQQIAKIAVDPRDPNRLFVAVMGHPYGPNEERGIFRSLDGGRTFTKVLYRDENTGGRDVDIDPANPNIIYATLWEARQGPWENAAWGGTKGGIFKSTDGGANWKQLANGIPESLTHAEIVVAPSDSRRLYAIIAGGTGSVFYRSDDAGETWTKPTTDTRAGGQRVTESLPLVHPKNADIVIVTDVVTMKSTDGGKTWVPFKGAPGGEDYQGGWINPDNPDIMLIVADQGAVVTLNGGDTWSSWYNQPTAQFYHVAADYNFPYRLCGGQQETGSACVASRGNYGAISDRDWLPVGVDEYGYAAPDPLNPHLVYGGRSVTRFDWRTGQTSTVGPSAGSSTGSGRAGGQALTFRQVRTHPVVFSEADKRALFFGNNYLWKTIDGGINWTRLSDDLTRKNHEVPKSVGSYTPQAQSQVNNNGARVIYTIGPSPLDVNRIWIGTDDGVIQTTADSGAHWTDVTPPQMGSYWKVFMIDAGRFSALTAYAAVNTLRIDDMRPHLYRTHDAGKTWTEIVDGMGDAGPANAVREDPKRKGLLYAATEKGVYVSFDDGDHWQSLRLNLPASSVRDLIVKDDDIAVGTHGRGFWILDNIMPLRQLSAATTSQDAFLFKPTTAWRVRWNTSTDMPWPKEEPTMPNPPEGVAIDYYLKANATGPVTLEILTTDGRLVRRYSSTDPVPPTPELATSPVPLYWYRPSQSVSTAAGMHRFMWDVHYQPLGAGGGGRGGLGIQAVPYNTAPGAGTPWVTPGTYTVKLTANGKSYTQPIVVKQDPRVKTPALVMQQVYTLTKSAYFAAADAQAAQQQARNVRDQIAQLQTRANGATKQALDEFEKKLQSALPAPLSAAVMNSLNAADVQPTANQLAALNSALATAREGMTKWTTLKTVDVPALNLKLKAAGLPALTVK